jgi:hypothetical protein
VSEDAIDFAHEEQLKAEEGYRELWVRFSWGQNKRVRTFPDTATWRVAVDKLAAELGSDPEVVKVWSIPMGTGEVAGGREPSALVDGSTPPPSGCCKPETYAGPSGVRLRHAAGCRYQGSPYEGPVARVDRLARRHAIETRRVGLDDADPVDRVGGVLTAVGPQCPAHPHEPADECPTCSDRRL